MSTSSGLRVRRRYAGGDLDLEGGDRFRFGSESAGSGDGSRIADATSIFVRLSYWTDATTRRRCGQSRGHL